VYEAFGVFEFGLNASGETDGLNVVGKLRASAS
jgi:hypothetical protein